MAIDKLARLVHSLQKGKVIIMTGKVRNMLRGAGSIMDIAPATNYGKYVPEKNIAKRMEGHFTRVGKNIQAAMNRFSNEQKNKK
jgi:hypothetical protein